MNILPRFHFIFNYHMFSYWIMRIYFNAEKEYILLDKQVVALKIQVEEKIMRMRFCYCIIFYVESNFGDQVYWSSPGNEKKTTIQAYTLGRIWTGCTQTHNVFIGYKSYRMIKALNAWIYVHLSDEVGPAWTVTTGATKTEQKLSKRLPNQLPHRLMNRLMNRRHWQSRNNGPNHQLNFCNIRFWTPLIHL